MQEKQKFNLGLKIEKVSPPENGGEWTEDKEEKLKDIEEQLREIEEELKKREPVAFSILGSEEKTKEEKPKAPSFNFSESGVTIENKGDIVIEEKKEKPTLKIEHKGDIVLEKNEEDDNIIVAKKEYEIMKELGEEIGKTEKYIKALGWRNSKEKREQNDKLEKLIEKYTETEKIFQDRNKNPFIYYAIEKSANPILLEKYTNQYAQLLDLKALNKNSEEIGFRHIEEIKNGEGLLKCNIFGFVLIIKEREKFLRNELGYRNEPNHSIFTDPEAIFKIVGPNGEIIKDNINGYTEANEIYVERTKNYKEKLINEYELEKLEE